MPVCTIAPTWVRPGLTSFKRGNVTDALVHYRTCIVRAWLESGVEAHKKTWRLTLEVPAMGLCRGFHDRDEFLDALLAHLFADVDDVPSADPA